MRRQLFERIVADLINDQDSNYFVHRPDATGRMSATPELKATAALRMLAYGTSADQLDEFVRLGASTVLLTLQKFCESVIRIYGAEYLRKPTPADLELLLAENAARGFPGMIGSIDCMHWSWKNCPTAWQGVFRGKEPEPTIILEAVASRSLWVWHAFFGTPGSNNDVNVLERSPLLNEYINGDAPQVQFTVNGSTYNRAYYLADGIYPPWAIFQQTIREPQGHKRRMYAKMQEGVRKDIERAFGVLQQRFRFLALPCKLWHADAMHQVVIACIILHNMIVEDELPDSAYTSEYLFEDGWVSEARITRVDADVVELIVDELRIIEDKDAHYDLKNDLIEHVWHTYGEQDDQ
jgi:hypothetical protein